MQLTLWTYEGPPHVGAMRIATAMRDVHYVLHAPQGDTYADLLFTMIERRDRRPPVTYTTFQARDLGGDTAGLFQRAVGDAQRRHRPAAMLVGASCTAELLQDDPAGLAAALQLPIPVIPLELPSYQRRENWGAAETFYQLVRTLAARPADEAVTAGADASTPGSAATAAATSAASSTATTAAAAPRRPRCNLLGPTALGFRHRDDVTELRRLLTGLGIDIHVVAPMDAHAADIARLGEADFNVVMYPEIALPAARWLERHLRQPMTTVVPIGIGATRDFVAEVCRLAGLAPPTGPEAAEPRAAWYARSIDSTYLTGKRVFVFGDATHVVAAARIARDEIGFDVVGVGTYGREFAREVRAVARDLGVDALITDDYLEVEHAIETLRPDLVLGTQMERHIAKRLGIACAVISAPVHVQDYPARYAPQMGFEGANVLFDTWIHPLMMGLEEHLLAMFRDDFEFSPDAPASHLGATQATPGRAGRTDGAGRSEDARRSDEAGRSDEAARSDPAGRPDDARRSDEPGPAVAPSWHIDAEIELRKIPFFVRGKARRNTEQFARERALPLITVETLYDAKAHFSR